MRIICDLLSTIMPPPLDLSENFHRPDTLPLRHLLDPAVYAGPSQTNRKEGGNNA